ncbi:MAG: cation-translocating P-type ATPase [Verrucomicrobiota bacterium]
MHSVANALATEPALEAVTFSERGDSVSVATLGKAYDPALEKRVAETIRHARERSLGLDCGLLKGEPDCFGCTIPFAKFERQSITIKHDAEKTTIARVTCPTAPRFWHWREISWPKLGPREFEIPEEDAHLDEWKWQLLAAGLCGAFAIAAAFSGKNNFGLGLYLAAYLAGAWFATVEVFELLRKQKLDVHFLMLAVAFGSATIGAWGEGSTLLFLFSLSGALEHYAMGRTQREIRSLFKAAPKVAILLDEQGNEREVSVEELRPGMRLLIKPDSQFAVDAEIVKGKTASDESNLTGESTPVEKTLGDTVLAGTLNLSGVVEVTVLRPANESALQKIIHLIKEAQHLKAPAQRFTDKFGTRYTYGILTLSFVMFFVWWLAFGLPAFTANGSGPSAFYRTMTLLVVASPCALVLSIPSAVLAAIAWSARRGILFRGGAAVEKLAEIKVVALDKTGTLTTGELRVERVESFPPGREMEIATLAYSLERFSKHPLARAITRYGKQTQLRALDLEHFESVPGQGLQATLDEKTVFLGKAEWLIGKMPVNNSSHFDGRDFAHSEVWLTDGDLTGRILLRDDIRPQAREVMAKIREAGLKTVVLTGDRHATAENLKTKLQLDDVRAELKPEQKVEIIHSFTQQNLPVAMIGDGVNDAPSLAAAHVGVAMGARGSDAALEQAEVVLMHDRLENFWSAYQLSQRARKIIRQNLVISLGTVAVLVSFAMFGAIPLTLGVIGHEGSTVLVVMNSLRLLFRRTG